MTTKDMKNARILWGICGIGLGHTLRQAPLIEFFAKNNRLVLFAYGESYAYYRETYFNRPNVSVCNVSVPFYPGNAEGLDFAAAALQTEKQTNPTEINARAMAVAWEALRRPDLVVSDYEPVAAQYAYACDAPLVTIDQQSKYLIGDFQESLQGSAFLDEQMRLRMFFPKAAERLACSFFRVSKRPDARETVVLCPPVLRQAILDLPQLPRGKRPSLLVYVSSQQPFGQSVDELVAIVKNVPGVDFNIFVKKADERNDDNITLRPFGHRAFYDCLARCDGVVTTAGHGLLSEAMHLGRPVYAIPLPLYEQQMNAQVIDSNGFGLARSKLDVDSLRLFVDDLPRFAEAIQNDRAVLLRRPGQRVIIDRLQKHLNEPRR
jgi:uncharacterized protein (TIGR00661 family)